MWQRIRNWLIGQPTDEKNRPAHVNIGETRLKDLRVIPDDGEDFDANSCQRLIDVLIERGASTVDDVLNNRIRVTLEQFFNGNHSKHSIAANVCPEAPFDTAESWFKHLKKIRENPRVHAVVVEVSMVEPFEDGHIGTWPYADTVWIYSELDKDEMTALLEPLDPDEVLDGSTISSDSVGSQPERNSDAVTAYRIWWD